MIFSFKLDGKKYFSNELPFEKSQDGEKYMLDGLVITRVRQFLESGAEYSLLRWEYTGAGKSGVLSDICDIDEALLSPAPFTDSAVSGTGLPQGYSGYPYTTAGALKPLKQSDSIPSVKLRDTVGSNMSRDEFAITGHKITKRGFYHRPIGGRSSDGYAPFFEITDGHDFSADGDNGFLFAIGWTGQWFSDVEPDADGKSVRVRAGVADLNFYLNPGESVRTASILLLPYSDGSVNAHNQFRRIIKEHFSLIGKRGRDAVAPFSFQTWGGAKSTFLKEAAKRNITDNLGFEYFWIDAGWYGDYEGESPDEFTGNWSLYVGDWEVNRRVHPNGLKDVFLTAEESGMKPLLWLEPERAAKPSGAFTRHPDLYILSDNGEMGLLNLAKPEAQQYMYNLVAGYVEELGLKCYRQDFNMEPLLYWNKADTENNDGRRGITQLKYIEGLYKVWDSLLSNFPDLIIDNCASGGRRIDIETVSRSIPLWRSDFNCYFDFDPNAAQNHNVGLSRWIPYHSCGASRYPDDKYRFRSCHAVGLATNFAGYWAFKGYKCNIKLLNELIAEYKSVRDFYACDYYPIFGFGRENTVWGGWQFDRPETGEGIVLAFRRDEAKKDRYIAKLCGLRLSETYILIDADSGVEITKTGAELVENGLEIIIKKKHDSRLIRYKVQ